MVNARLEGRPFVAAGYTREILFVDPGVDSASTLLAGLRPEVEVVRLPARGDPIATIALHMAGRRDISALHILSHGAPGALALSGQRIDTAALAARPALTTAIRDALSDDAEIVLYGCSVAQGAHGAAFVAALSALLDRPVAASAGPVGARELGGDWAIPARGALAFDADARAAYPATLITATFGIVTTLNTTTTLTSNEGGITLSVTKSDGAALAGVSSGFLDPGVIANTVTYTVTFQTAVNVTQFQIGEFVNNSDGSNYVFTPNTGTAVTIADNAGALAGSVATLSPVDWTGISSFTVSYAGTANWRTGLDNIVFASAGPATPSTPDLLAASDTGVSSTDNITSNSLPTITGTADASTSVHILVGGATVGTTTSDGGGNWTFAFTSTLAAGANSVTAVADNGSVESSASSGLTITVDTTAPTTLGTPDLLAASDTGVSSTDNITNSATQQLSGSATTGDIVSILVGGVTVNTVTAAGGSWSYTHT
ncbi:MAG: DUF4347 domain-containing protein, partial [Alphaproteobacteria bacterium]|nr:DUF4347 domain-containing protein [Alphaproteobacteria bacterium]